MQTRSVLFVTFTLLTVFTLLFSVTYSKFAFAKEKTDESKALKLSSAAVTFVEIGSVNCIPCRAMQPIMKEIEEQYKGQVKIVFHDVWTEQGKKDAMKYNIRVIPTQVFLDKSGKEFFRHEGFFQKEAIVRLLTMHGIK